MRSKEFTNPGSAGILLYAEDTGRYGFQQRSDSVNDPGVWAAWGGGRKSGESLEQCALRELAEESGYQGPVGLEPLARNSRYVTFIGRVPREFDPTPNAEVKDHCWVDAGAWPSPMHPGMSQALRGLDPIKPALTESLSRVAFHYTTIGSALKIVSSGEFELSSTLGSVEQQYAPRGKPYFLSTTRSRQGGYHDIIGQQAVLFVLDGNWFNQHYVSRPVDYWENRNPSLPHHRTHEAEDRVFSSEPTIPTGGVTAIHVYVDPDAEPEVRAQARQLMIAAKRQGIETHLYNDKTAWRNFDQRRTAAVSQLTGQEPARYRSRPEREYLLPWIELISAQSQSQLSKDADRIRYSLMYDYDRDNAAQGLNTDLSNARKPSAGADRANAVKIIKFMQRNGLATVKDLVQALSNKWRAEKKQPNVSENFADGITFSHSVSYDHEDNPIALNIIAHSNGQKVGYIEFATDDPQSGIWWSEHTAVNPQYQRQGIARSMYDYAKGLKNIVKQIFPSPNQSPGGKAIWKDKKVWENFADGRNPGRKGLAKRVGVDCKQPVSKLRSIAKNSSGERQRMAHWCANMKSGKKK
jgi:8-oxo-dGTP pyrophosphatase MutT (NUDIX family)/ribosomal protein S18 acetylase RimI-like enzyme